MLFSPEEEVVSAFKNLLKRSEADLERLNEREQQLVDEINLMKNKEDQRVSDDSNIPINSSDFISKLKQKNFVSFALFTTERFIVTHI